MILRALTMDDLTRSQLAVKTGISKVTVTSIITDLMHQGLVHDLGQQEGQTGRPASLVGLASNIGTALGVDVQPQRITVYAANLRNTTTRTIVTPVSERQALTTTLIHALNEVRRLAPFGPLTRVVVAVPAPTDGWALHEPNAIPELNTEAVTSWSNEHDILLTFENDTNLAAVAEHRTGAARNADPFAVLLERNTGIGLGLFLCGALYRGQHGRAGELGEVRWPGGTGRLDTLLETLAPAPRYDALAYLLSALAATLDLSLLVISLNENESLARHVRQLVPPSVGVTVAMHGDAGPVHGALLTAVDHARHIVFSTSTEVLA